MESDNTHGNAIYNTFFRNHTTGFRAKFTDYLNHQVVDDIHQQSSNAPLRTASPHAYSYWNDFIGNVLGIEGEMAGFVYGDQVMAPGDWPPQIYMMGWDDLPNQVYDPEAIKTNFIDGNFDYVTNAVKWASSNHTLPNSLFLKAAPSFFAGHTWPWVDPTGSTKLYTLPAKLRYDAGTPFTP
jgi:hypothetical protein